MYESPIEIFMDEIQSQIVKDQENGIYKAITNYGISVDKDELVKALQYDRNQYYRGYKDGARELADQLKRALSVFDIELHIIDTILKDMGVH